MDKYKTELNKKLLIFTLLALTLFIFFPILQSVFVGVIFASAFYPFFEWINRKIRLSKGLLSLLFTVMFSFSMVTTTTGLVIFGTQFGIREATEIKQDKKAQDSVKEVTKWFDADFASWKLSKWIPVLDRSDLRNTIKENSKSFITKFTEGINELLKNTVGLIVSLCVVFVSFYGSNRYSSEILQLVKKISPFKSSQTKEYVDYFNSLCQFSILSSLAAGVVQASIMAVFCLIAGVDQVFAIVILVFFFSFIPFVGTAPISLLVIALELFNGNVDGVLILTIGALVMGISDNVIRSIFISKYHFMPSILAFFAFLGGVIVLGPLGIFTAPVIVGLTWKLLPALDKK